jgi:nucleoid DNA-binding protein
MADRRLVAAMARRSFQSQAMMKVALEALLAEVRTRLREDGEVRIDGFGRFVIRSTGRKVCRNFHTGEVTETVGRDRVRFESFGSVMTGRRSRWHVKPS